ncbi:hypothetical protein ACSSV5_001199 [Psychroflexus sp. MBR-150]|jgi:hypothetical protein
MCSCYILLLSDTYLNIYPIIFSFTINDCFQKADKLITLKFISALVAEKSYFLSNETFQFPNAPSDESINPASISYT